MSRLLSIISKYVKRKNFIADFTKEIKSGIDHRISQTPTNSSDKVNIAVTQDDMEKFCDGADNFISELQSAVKETREGFIKVTE